MRVSATTRAALPLLLVLGIVPLLIHVAIVTTSQGHAAALAGIPRLFRLGVVTASALTHWTIYGGLLLTFGLTLRPGRVALLTTMARKMHGPLSDEVTVYTRRATWAWCGFFAVQLTTSVTLFLFAPLVIWSFFVNVLDLPLVATMFAAEYLCRLNCLREPPRQSLAQIVRLITDVRKPGDEPAGLP
jgi:uncharacterized membrane protein